MRNVTRFLGLSRVVWGDLENLVSSRGAPHQKIIYPPGVSRGPKKVRGVFSLGEGGEVGEKLVGGGVVSLKTLYRTCRLVSHTPARSPKAILGGRGQTPENLTNVSPYPLAFLFTPNLLLWYKVWYNGVKQASDACPA